MKNENIVRTLERIVAEADELSKGKSVVEIEEDPRICALMMQAEPIIEEIDQIVNTAFPNHPEKVAHWRKAMGLWGLRMKRVMSDGESGVRSQESEEIICH